MIPEQPISKIEAPYATLYRAAVAIGTQETQLIWTRYTGFVVMNGFLITILAHPDQRALPMTLLIVGVVALVLNCVWHILNYAGWQNQNLEYHLAARLFAAKTGLFTDYYQEKSFRPFGWIYWLAQVIPTLFSILGAAGLVISLKEELGYWSLCAGAGTWLILVGVVVLIEYWAIAGLVRGERLRPA